MIVSVDDSVFVVIVGNLFLVWLFYSYYVCGMYVHMFLYT